MNHETFNRASHGKLTKLYFKIYFSSNFPKHGGTSANRTSSFAFGLHMFSRPQGG
jgi:hypothetical protein